MRLLDSRAKGKESSKRRRAGYSSNRLTCSQPERARPAEGMKGEHAECLRSGADVHQLRLERTRGPRGFVWSINNACAPNALESRTHARRPPFSQYLVLATTRTELCSRCQWRAILTGPSLPLHANLIDPGVPGYYIILLTYHLGPPSWLLSLALSSSPASNAY